MRETTTIMCTHSGDEHPWKPESDCPDAIPAGTWSVRTSAVSDAHRAKAADLLDGCGAYAGARVQAELRVAAALAEARAPYARLTADLRALAEELSGPAKLALSYGAIAARLRAVVAATEGARA